MDYKHYICYLNNMRNYHRTINGCKQYYYGLTKVALRYTIQHMKRIQSEGWCSANWRDYQASWSINNVNLYLESINISPCFDNDNFLTIHKLLNSNEKSIRNLVHR